MAIGQGEKQPVCNGNQVEDSRLHPAKVRVKFFESQPVAQVLPPLSSSTLSSPDVTLDLSTDTMTSPVSDSYHRQISAESGVDNPFRPDGELSREADTIVNLIREGKPITPVKSDECDHQLPEGGGGGGPVVANGCQQVSDSLVKEELLTPTDASGAKLESVKQLAGANGSASVAAGANSGAANNASGPRQAVGVVEVQHGVIAPPSDGPQVEQVTIKKKPKCKCCVIQ